jgi:hypothetical protein
MGWSHAVYVAQLVNENILYRSGLLTRSRNLVTGAVPSPYEPVHSAYIDDLLALHLVPEAGGREEIEAARTLHIDVKEEYKRNGFPVNMKKDVAPTFDPVVMLGMEVGDSWVRPPLVKLLPLLVRTLHLVRHGATSKDLERLVGGWSWLCLLRRPSL